MMLYMFSIEIFWYLIISDFEMWLAQNVPKFLYFQKSQVTFGKYLKWNNLTKLGVLNHTHCWKQLFWNSRKCHFIRSKWRFSSFWSNFNLLLAKNRWKIKVFKIASIDFCITLKSIPDIKTGLSSVPRLQIFGLLGYFWGRLWAIFL